MKKIKEFLYSYNPLSSLVKSKKIPQDIIGDIAILKFKKSTPWILKKFRSKRFLKNNPSIKTILEKTEKFSGRLRIQKTNWLAGEKTTKAVYRENDCIFKFDVNETYFSPRLSNERKVLAEEISKLVQGNKKKILVMFAGVGPFPIVIGRRLKLERKEAVIFSNELNRQANEFAKENIHLNKLSKNIFLLEGDAKAIPKKTKEKFDIILMARPNLKETFLKTALKVSKKGTTIFYYGFGTEDSVLEEIKDSCKNKIGKITLRKAGDIGKEIYRWLAKFKVL